MNSINKKNRRNYTIVKGPDQVNFSNGEYVKLGERLRNNHRENLPIPMDDLEKLQVLRTSYKKSLSQIFEILQKSIKKVNKGAIITYRVKRIDSIISKLVRNKNMQLHRIEDIAGCRCIFSNNDQVYQFKSILQKELFIKSDRNDYIASPKSDGYKSLHLIVQTLDKKSKPIELQLRCEQDHNWATLVEITDIVYNSRIKELGNEPELGRMLFLFSKGIESLENSEVDELIDLIEKKDFIKKINSVFVQNSINVRKQWSEIDKNPAKSFYLIQVDNNNNSFISSYINFSQAEFAYFERFTKNRNHNIVLTHIPNARFEQISKAYSNYTLTYHAFFHDLMSKLQQYVKLSFIDKNFTGFSKYFKLFVYIYFDHTKLQFYEMYALRNANCKIMKKHEWQVDINQRLKKNLKKKNDVVQQLNLKYHNLYHLFTIVKINKIWRSYSKKFTKDIEELSNIG